MPCDSYMPLMWDAIYDLDVRYIALYYCCWPFANVLANSHVMLFEHYFYKHLNISFILSATFIMFHIIRQLTVIYTLPSVSYFFTYERSVNLITNIKLKQYAYCYISFLPFCWNSLFMTWNRSVYSHFIFHGSIKLLGPTCYLLLYFPVLRFRSTHEGCKAYQKRKTWKWAFTVKMLFVSYTFGSKNAKQHRFDDKTCTRILID